MKTCLFPGWLGNRRQNPIEVEDQAPARRSIEQLTDPATWPA